MYDTRWPRPGPAMAAACAAVGLLVGVALGLSSGGSPAAEARASAETTRRPTTTLPDRFYTVILASLNQRTGATAAVADLKAKGVRDAGVLTRTDYPTLGTQFAVYSGQFDSSGPAEAHQRELAGRGIEGFVKPVSR
jgi:cell division septation protein DedD